MLIQSVMCGLGFNRLLYLTVSVSLHIAVMETLTETIWERKGLSYLTVSEGFQPVKTGRHGGSLHSRRSVLRLFG